jgi:DNA-directed RNA polymerase specialized sigma subunit
MKERARWNLSKRDIGHISTALKPLRTRREVGEILDLSTSTICQLENSALRKIARAMRRMDEAGKAGESRSSIIS